MLESRAPVPALTADSKSFHVRLTILCALPLLVYAAGSMWLGRAELITFGNVMQCIVPLFASAGLLMNATSPHWRRNVFWMLLALGCTLWLAGQLLWTYYEVHLGQQTPTPFIGDVIFFLHTVPLIGALALRPDTQRLDASFRVAYLDFLFLLLWWIYLYLFIVIPWQYIQIDEARYDISYDVLSFVERAVFASGLIIFYLRASGHWKKVYFHLAGAAVTYTLTSLTINRMLSWDVYYTGNLIDLPLIGSFIWFGAAGLLAHRYERTAQAAPAEVTVQGAEAWPARLAMLAILSLPPMALWAERNPDTPADVKDFRIVLTLIAIMAFTALQLIRQVMAERERQQLLLEARGSLENLQRLQSQFVQSERMASLGQLAAGAAHEINNPLTAILGYVDVLTEDPALPEKQRSLVEKVRDQARRTKTLLSNLLSFARQAPSEKSLLDINPVVNNAVQLRTLDLRSKNIRIHVQAESVLPAVRGDANQILQVFFNLISNAVEAMEEVGGGTLTVLTKREKNNVVIDFSDTGPGIARPDLVFDPFYTTKPVGKGTGLGLSICYGIVKEHDGNITCFNRHQGGATFRVELPAATAVLPKPGAEGAPKASAL